MANLFNSIRVKKPKRSLFNLSHEVKLTTNIGVLTPILMQDIVPGDTWQMSSEVFLRFAPLTAPIMQNIDVFVHFFFVPYRLIWDDFEDFITGGEEGLSAPELPNIALGDMSRFSLFNGTLADYMGIPTNNNDNLVLNSNQKISLLPFRAYQFIYNEYYRDQNLTPEVEFSTASGKVTEWSQEMDDLFALRYRAWEKDMFTSALPTPQRGPDVCIPVQESEIEVTRTDYGQTRYEDANPGETIETGPNGILRTSQSKSDVNLIQENEQFTGVLKALNATLTDFRTAMKVQELYELAARVGSRYVEQLLGFFGVKSSDARLQRPEYLGGGRAPVIVSDVVQQSQTTDSSVLGDLAGKGVAMARANTFKRYFEEHGILMGILSVRPRSSYMDGLPRYFGKQNRFDFYFPQFAHLGEQEVKKGEVNFLFNDPNHYNDLPFGYTPRYAEYKYIPGSVHGDFRDSLMPWHLARHFNGTANLNTQFVEVRPNENNRIFAVTDDETEPYNQKLWIQVYNKIKAKRPMPKFGTPHF